MNKGEFIDRLANDTGFTKVDSKLALDSVLDIITHTVSENEEVQLTGFGKFEPSPRKETTAVNPQTGEKMRVPSKVVPKFRAGKNLKEAVRENLEAIESGSGKLEVKQS